MREGVDPLRPAVHTHLPFFVPYGAPQAVVGFERWNALIYNVHTLHGGDAVRGDAKPDTDKHKPTLEQLEAHATKTWEQLLEAETMMDTEVNSVQAEAERLQKGWGQGVFSQAYQMLRQERSEEQRAAQAESRARQLEDDVVCRGLPLALDDHPTAVKVDHREGGRRPLMVVAPRGHRRVLGAEA